MAAIPTPLLDDRTPEAVQDRSGALLEQEAQDGHHGDPNEERDADGGMQERDVGGESSGEEHE
ncbi:hypothetical protein [Streptomyces sp. NPDC094049]|uniref:hypothetical protein n=1 Tax=Streptomyces sp. NPDC094049 TaxID=3154987 RepID=UPI00331B543F